MSRDVGRNVRRRRWLRALALLAVAVVVLRRAGQRTPVSAQLGFDSGGGSAGGPDPDEGPSGSGGPKPGPRPDDGSGGGPRDGGVREPRRPRPGPYGVAEHRPEPAEPVEFLEPGQPDRVVVGGGEQ